MSFYSSKKILINISISLISMLIVAVGFQNCSNGLSSSTPASNTASAVTDNSGMRVINDDSNSSSTTTGSTSLKIDLLATDLLKVDCSIPGASYKFEVSNAGSDITMCQEYTLDMPQGNARYGESSKCDSSDKFVKPSSAWSYDAVQKKWSKTTQTSGDQYVPGDYRLYVRDSLGEARSSLLKIRHYGYVNCVNPNPVIAEQPGTGGGSVPTNGTTTVVTSCSWSGNDFSPAHPPTSTCSESRANAKENGASGIEYTCLCTQTTVVQAPTQPPVSTAPVTNPGGSPPASTQPQTGFCNPAGTSLARVTTNLPIQSFPRTDYHPEPNQIYSFAFKTVASGAAATGQLSVAQLSSSMGGKLAVVSTCPGDIETAGKDPGCYRFGAETSTVFYTVNSPTPIKPTFYCNLKPNTQYYYNVVPRQTSSGASICTGVTNCGFSFLGN